MISEEMCDLIIDQYYDTVFRYCLKRLRKTEDAEDCAQETFLIFFQKRKILFMRSNIKTWLLKTADNVIKRYQEKNWHNDANIDDLSELLPDTGGEAIDPLRYIEDFISKEDAVLLRKYVMCNTKQEREALAKSYNMTLNNLTTRISRIKKKITNKIVGDFVLIGENLAAKHMFLFFNFSGCKRSINTLLPPAYYRMYSKRTLPQQSPPLLSVFIRTQIRPVKQLDVNALCSVTHLALSGHLQQGRSQQ